MQEREKVEKALDKAEKTLQDYHVAYMGVYGSQNYNLSNENSDVDLRAIVIPDFETMAKRQKISKKLQYEYGDIDLKDLWTYYQSLSKGNPSFIEPLRSKFYRGDPYLREIFAKARVNRWALVGMGFQKWEKLNKGEDIGKSLYHVLRVLDMLDQAEPPSYIPYQDESAQRMRNIKTQDVLTDNDNIFERLIEHRKRVQNNYRYVPQDVSDKVVEYIKQKGVKVW